MRSFDTFQQFGKGTARIGSPLSANSSSPVHTPLSSTSSLPISSFSTSNNNPFSFSFPSTNPLISDPFGFTSNTATTNTKLLPLKTDMNSFFPDVVQTSFKSNGLVSSNNNNITLPAIATHAPAPAQKGKVKLFGLIALASFLHAYFSFFPIAILDHSVRIGDPLDAKQIHQER